MAQQIELKPKPLKINFGTGLIYILGPFASLVCLPLNFAQKFVLLATLLFWSTITCKLFITAWSTGTLRNHAVLNIGLQDGYKPYVGPIFTAGALGHLLFFVVMSPTFLKLWDMVEPEFSSTNIVKFSTLLGSGATVIGVSISAITCVRLGQPLGRTEKSLAHDIGELALRFLQRVVAFLITGAFLGQFYYENIHSPDGPPSLMIALFQIAAARAVDSPIRYFAHVIYHCPVLYRNIHYTHHSPAAFEHLLAPDHPFEEFTTIFFGVIGPICTRMHSAILFFWVVDLIMKHEYEHSLADTSAHLLHDRFTEKNFEATGLIDSFFGTAISFEEAGAIKETIKENKLQHYVLKG